MTYSSPAPLTPQGPHNFTWFCVHSDLPLPFSSQNSVYPPTPPRLILPTVVLIPFSFLPTFPYSQPVAQSNQTLFSRQFSFYIQQLPLLGLWLQLSASQEGGKAGECPSPGLPPFFFTSFISQFLKTLPKWASWTCICLLHIASKTFLPKSILVCMIGFLEPSTSLNDILV